MEAHSAAHPMLQPRRTADAPQLSVWSPHVLMHWLCMSPPKHTLCSCIGFARHLPSRPADVESHVVSCAMDTCKKPSGVHLSLLLLNESGRCVKDVYPGVVWGAPHPSSGSD
eukprot:356948-Chlamydomonas_euryale.AAC.3